jgi:hypothetical protein
LSRSGSIFGAAVLAVAALAWGGAAYGAIAGSGSPTVATDRADYAPGDIVSLTGSGWQAGEVVHVTVNDTAGTDWSAVADVAAADDGTLVVAVVLPDQVISEYTVTATGPLSGTATTTFTDAAALTLTIGTRTVYFNVSPSFQGSAFNDKPVTLTATDASGAVVATLDVVPSCSSKGTCNYGSVSFAAGALPDGQLTVTATEPLSTGKPPSVSFFMDTRPPTATITFPSDGGSYDASNWGCGAEGGFCGSVGDPSPSSGASAQVALRNAAGLWWNGSAFVSSATPLWQSTSFNPWVYVRWTRSSGTFTVFARGTDKAGNVGPATSVTFTYNSDTTPPAIAFKQSPHGANGWFTSAPARLRVTAKDDSSGTRSLECTLDGSPVALEPVYVEGVDIAGELTTSEPGRHIVECAAIDGAANLNHGSTSLKLDTTPPLVQLRVDGTQGANGWYTSDVVVTTVGSDDESGPVSCWGPQTVSTDTAGTEVYGLCTNEAGLNKDATVTIKRDASAPEVGVTGVAAGATYLRGAVPAAGCSTYDSTSGVATPAALTLSGGSVNGVGTFTATCAGAQDNAGNSGSASVTYTVAYDGVSGILQPINPDGTSVFNRGQVVPVKLRLGGDEATAGYVTSAWRIARVATSCTDGSGIDENVGSSTPSTSFRYDSAADQYIYNADFRDVAANTCWRIWVTLDSGQVLTSALFRVK